MKLEFSSLWNSLGIMIIIILCLVVVYYVCMFFDQGIEMMPPFVQNIHNHFFVKHIGSEFDTGYKMIMDMHIPEEEEEEVSVTPKEEVKKVSVTPKEEVKEVSVSPKEEEVAPPKDNTESCPTLLTEKDGKIMLLNENMPKVPGKNPLYFDTLDEYVIYTENRRKETNMKCPVLELKKDTSRGTLDKLDLSSINTISDYFQQRAPQNTIVQSRQPIIPVEPYRPCPMYNMPLPYQAKFALNEAPRLPVVKKQHPPLVPYLDANRDLNPKGHYGFDPSDQYIGKYTILDEIHHSTKTEFPSGLSANAMDTNWGGAVFTNDKLKEGDYKESEISMTAPKPLSIIDQQEPSKLPQNQLQKPNELPKHQQSTIVAANSSESNPQSSGGAADAMSANWGGVQYSEDAVKAGKYKGDEVEIRTV